ncbi:MAG: hypothetical protein HQ518_18285 [Rhodopirellula sp.]|nr:hypothetical protein [Rhodopirellula sp.]
MSTGVGVREFPLMSTNRKVRRHLLASVVELDDASKFAPASHSTIA